MPKADPGGKRGGLIPGTLDMLIFKAISRGRTHGYAIAEWIHSVSEETLQVEEGVLYPALHRLELKGMLDSDWTISETKRRVKSYRLTAAGKKYMAQEKEDWGRLAFAMTRVMDDV
jgi:PadR family transcriptional regulator PadR